MNNKSMLAAVHAAAKPDAMSVEDEETTVDAGAGVEVEDTVEPADNGGEPENGEGAGDGNQADAELKPAEVLTTDQMAKVRDWSDDETKCFAAGVDYERGRLAAIDDATLPGHEDLASEAKFGAPVSLAEFLQQQTAAEKAMRTNRSTSLDEDEAALAGLRSAHRPANPSAGLAPAMSDEDRWRTEFSASSKLRSEFADVGDYVALKKREQAAG